MVFVVLGAVNLLSGKVRPAILFFGLGAMFYLHYFDIIHLRDFWPVILIGAGLSFLFKKKITPAVSNTSSDTFDEVTIFGGNEKKFTSQNFQGGKISCVFGGSEIDLRNVKAADGAVVEIFCAFGAVELYVPENWKVNLGVTAVFGGFSDERRISAAEPEATVHIKGMVLFGGGELKN
ncbi:MAG: DUF5668 domain-containing protein [Ekhidna sp.]